MGLDFASSITVGGASDLFERQRADDAPAEVPSSSKPRGLALRSLKVTGGWDRMWNLLRQKQQIYFLSIAFDLSEREPIILPPKEVPEGAVYKVAHGDTISFSLGDGAPIFPRRTIKGGLIVYITICEADKGIRHVGDVMAKVHKNLSKDKSLTKVITGFITSPGTTVADEVLGAATAALQPVATILQNNGDNYEALFTGIYSAKGPWKERLSATQNGATIELTELR